MSTIATGVSLRSMAVEGDRRRAGLLYWGAINLTAIFVVMFLPQFFVGIGVQRLIYFSVGVWVLASIGSGTVPLRVSLPLACLLLLQLWFGFTTLLGEVSLAHVNPINGLDYVCGTHAICFFLGFGMASLSPNARPFVARGFVAFLLVSGVVGILQFLGFGPAIQVGQWLKAQDVEVTLQGTTTIRSTGLFPQQGFPVYYTLAGIGLIIGGWSVKARRVPFSEIAIVVALLFFAISNQARNMFPAIALMGLLALIMLQTRNRMNSVALFAVLVITPVALAIYRPELFAYVLQSDSTTLQYRREVLWTQAVNVLSASPWTGIGTEPAFASWTTQVLPNRWVSTSLMDNGWMLAAAWGGYPAVFLLAVGVISACVGSVVVFLKSADYWQRSFSVAGFAIAVVFATGLFFNNIWSNAAMSAFLMVLGGMAMPVHGAKEKGLNSLKGATTSRLRSG